MFFEIKHNRVMLKIKAQPNASRSEFAETLEEAIKLRIKAPAVEGAANAELIKFLSKHFKIAKSSITFKSGLKSKIKIVEFPISEAFTQWSREYEQRTSL
ncbi:MAG: hypothetical protein KU38_13450 [Sulfurovum sp. FS08-3]|nr:MAG: hypothetical protein KU38_13450 [Sulfurovum sp. FS08-3]